MRKNKLLLLLALLMTAATGAWADETLLLTIESKDYTDFTSGSKTFDDMVTVNFSNSVYYNGEAGWYSDWDASLLTVAGTNGYTITSCKFYTKEGSAANGYTVQGESPSVYLSEEFVYTDASQSGVIGYPGIKKIEVYGTAPAGYTVSLKDGVKDADKWTVKVGDGEAQALPISNLKGGETVTLKYNGRLKVKGVKATSDEKPAAPSVTEVTTFSELQAALSAGKDVKLMNDIVCTSETEINSNGAFIEITSGALTIDGNGKKLSTTSEIRAFKVGSSATVAFKNLTLTGFVSGGGPAINNSGTIVLDGCTIGNCHVNNTNGGGAIENKSTGKLYAINTTFSGNYSGEIGGAINNYRGSLYMSGCTFTNNYTTKSNAYYGGAIGINGGSEIRLINCSFSGNQYGTNAGPSDIGVYSNPTNYTIAGCTGATIASNNGDITTIASGTATLDYSDLSNISFTYTAEGSASTPALSITSPSVGQVIGSDGKNYAAASVPSGVTKVAMIAYVSGSNGLAIALADEGKLNWATAKSTCEAKTPAFTGGTWKLPSQAEWNQMFSANGGDEERCYGLNTKINTAGGTALLEGGTGYWSSTSNGSNVWYVWLMDGDTDWRSGNVNLAKQVRACLAFTEEQAAKPAATVTTAPTGAAVVGVGKTTALVSGGVADGGTLMYAVTTTNTKPASTDGFSADVPTAQTITASGKVYVWYYVKGDDTHSDSEIAATAIEVPVAIIWDATNASDLYVSGTYSSYTKDGIKLSGNADNMNVSCYVFGDPTMDGIAFNANQSGGFTFTAPTGKAFTKIEMTLTTAGGWEYANLGTGWAFNWDDITEISTVTWKGSAAASTVDLLKDADFFSDTYVKCIAFYLSE